MKRLLIAAAIGLSSLAAHAVDMPISADEAYAKIQLADKDVLLVDVRDPVEIMFVGFTDAVHVNVPYLMVDRTQWNAERGEPSATFLRANGFPNARFVVNGFQGSAIKDGPQAGFRTQNGWQNSGLPWSAKMNPEKIHRIDRP